MICPQCRSAHCFRSHRRGLIDLAATSIGLRPWRCRTCDFRFYGWRVAVAFTRYAHCPTCGNFDLQRIGHDRVDKGTLLFVKRLIGFPAYRCDPCREKFYSVRPIRRIVPSVMPEPRSKSSRS
jgi:putative component of membrane protein insertase Oxa1/YidC/SpoIIIJ protein YidD